VEKWETRCACFSTFYIGLVKKVSFSTYLPQISVGYTPFTLSLGGYTCARPKEWEQYLLDQIRRLSPDYLMDEASASAHGPRWKENACILESIDRYLFEEFGFSMPENNIFKVFNQDGEGIPPGLILEVVSSLIQPFGFEIEKVLVPDAELRVEVGTMDDAVGMEQASVFHGRSGICMINIREGYSHAFFWKKMDCKKFSKPQFRMALLVKRVNGGVESTRSAPESLDIYCGVLTEYLAYIGSESQDGSSLEKLNREIRLLRRYVNTIRWRSSPNFRLTLERKLGYICGLLQEMNFYQDASEDEIIQVVEKLANRIIKEADECSLGAGLPS
jgi:hypothetical protein